MSTINILVFGVTENYGGIESVVINYWRKLQKEDLMGNIEKHRFHFDFLCNTKDKIVCEDELKEAGSNVYHIESRAKNYKQYKKELREFMGNNAYKYSIIWVNLCSLANIDYLKEAKKYGIKTRIIHSHNSRDTDSVLRGLLHKIHKQLIDKYATNYWACSTDAALWFYPRRLLNRVEIINNPIEVKKFVYSKDKRDKIRKQYKIEDKVVLGTIGRLNFQKNQSFSIEVLKKLIASKPDTVLMLVGQGEDEEKLKQKVHEEGLEGKVIFAGWQSDIQGYLSALDIYLFPSIFEGNSLIGLEAQANDLQIITNTDIMDEERVMTNNIHEEELDVDKWVDRIEKLINRKKLSRKDDVASIQKAFSEAGFSLDAESAELDWLFHSAKYKNESAEYIENQRRLWDERG